VPTDDIQAGGLIADKFSTLPQSKEPLTMNFFQLYGNIIYKQDDVCVLSVQCSEF